MQLLTNYKQLKTQNFVLDSLLTLRTSPTFVSSKEVPFRGFRGDSK
jgi:hypothetical protein